MSLMTEILSIIASASVVSGINWTKGSFVPGGASPAAYKGIAYNGVDTYIAISGSNLAAKSTDAVTWTNITILSAAYTGIVYGNNTWVATISSAKPAYSTDGLTWTQTTLAGTSLYPYKVAFSSGVFVGTGTGTTAGNMASIISTDGRSWQYTALPLGQAWSSVVYGTTAQNPNGIYVAVSSAAANTVVAYSVDGLLWSAGVLPSSQSWIKVAYGTPAAYPNGVFVAIYSASGTTCAASTDGINWASKAIGSTAGYTDVVFAQDTVAAKTGFFLISNTAYSTATQYSFSTDLTSWVRGQTASSGTWSTLAYGNGAIVTNNGTTLTGSTDFNLISATWTLATVPSTISKFIYGPSGFAGFVSNAKYYYNSTNGVNWTNSMPWLKASGQTIVDIAFGRTASNPNGTYVAVSSIATAAWATTSTDGYNWTSVNPPGTAAALSCVKFGSTALRPEGYFLAAFSATNTPVRSTDGRYWSSTGGSSYGSLTHGTPSSNPGGLFVAFSTAASTNVYTSTDTTNWRTITLPVSGLFRGTFGTPASNPEGLYVAVDRTTNSNKAVTSTDGVTWVSRTLSAAGSWQRITFGTPASNPEGLYVAVSSYTGSTANGTVASRSTNGINWTASTLPTSTGWTGIAYGTPSSNTTGLYVASSGTSGTTINAKSTDAITWTLTTTPVTGGFSNVVYGDGVYVFIDSALTAATGGGLFLPMSTDMVNWAGAYLPSRSAWTKGSYLNGYYYISNGNKFTKSTDLITWSNEVTVPQTMSSFAYGNKLVATVSTNPKVMTSTDDINWYSGAGFPTNKQWTSVANGNGLFVTVSSTSGTDSAVSTDGVNWTIGTLPVTGTWSLVTFGTPVSNPDGLFVALPNTSGTNAAATTNGVNWTIGTLPVTGTWSSITYGSNGFLATSDTTATANSSNGINWTLGTLPTTSVSSTSYPVSFAGNNYIAMPGTASGIVFTSSDAISWSNIAIASNIKFKATRAGDYFFIFSNTASDYITISTDGTNWSISLLPASLTWVSVASDGAGNYVIIPTSATRALYSTDAINWASGYLTENIAWKKVIYAENKFLAIASSSQAVNISTNGASWYSYTMPPSVNYSGLLNTGNGRVVCTNLSASRETSYSDDYGTTWRRTLLPASFTWVGSAYGLGKYVILSTTGQACYSTDLITWTQSTMLTDGVINWTGLSFDGTRFIAIAKDATTTTSWTYSLDGMNWEKTLPTIQAQAGIISMDYDTSTNIFAAIAYTNSRNSIKSTNGTNWTSSSPAWPVNLYITDIKSNNNSTWLATSRSYVYVLTASDPGGAWTVSTLPFATACAPGYGNGKFVCMNTSLSYAVSTNAYNWVSSTPTTAPSNSYKVCQGGKTISVETYYSSIMDNSTTMWTFSTMPRMPVTYSWSGLLSNGTNLLAYQSSQYYAYSTNSGVSWTLNTLPTTFGTGLVKMQANGTFYGIAGYRGYSSGDGINWTLCTVTYNSNGSWSDVAYGTPASNPGGLYVMVAGGTNNGTSTYNVLTSSSGGSNSWTAVYDSNGNSVDWAYIAYGNGKYVKSTATSTTTGRVSVSTNGVNWTMSAFNANGYTSRIIFAGGTINKFLLPRKGGVYNSTDGVTWVDSTTTTSTTVVPNFCYDSVNDRIVADDPTSSAKMYYSTNAINWQLLRNGSAVTQPTSITYGNGIYVAVYTNSDVTYSTDAFSWTLGTMPLSTSWQSIDFGNGQFKAIADNRIASSTDAITWTLTTTPVTQTSYGWQSIKYTGNGQWCALPSGSATDISKALFSSDGITWTQTTFDNASGSPVASVYTGKFVAVYAGTNSNLLYTSATGRSWKKPALPTAAAWIAIASDASGKSVVIPNTAANTAVALTTNGYNWSTSGLGISATWNSISYVNSKFIALSTTVNSSVSTDGVYWTIGTIPTSSTWESAAYGLIGATPTYVIVSSGSTNVCFTSTNAVNWVQRTLPYTVSLYKVSYINNRFMAVGNSPSVYYSTDGITWLASGLSSNTTWQTVAYNGNNRYVAIAGSGTASAVANYSTDGITWLAATMASTATWTDVIVNPTNGNFVAIGGLTSASTAVNNSTNGINWSLATLPYSSTWSGIAYGSGNFVAVAGYGSATSYSASSTDGVSWSPANMPSSSKWNGVAYGNNKFIASALDSYEVAQVII